MAAVSDTFKLAPEKDREIVLTREFDAPRELVFKAMTDPKHVPNWWGPRKYTTIVDKLEVRPGGKWRFINRGPEGETAFRGEYRKIVPNERIVWTFEWEGLPGHVSVETAVLEEKGNGRTRLTATSVFANKEDRDGMLQSGMETGARESYERLDEILAQLRQKR